MCKKGYRKYGMCAGVEKRGMVCVCVRTRAHVWRHVLCESWIVSVGRILVE